MCKGYVRLGVIAREHLVIVNEHTRGNERAIVSRLSIAFNNQRHELLLLVVVSETELAFLDGFLRVLIEALNGEDSKGG